MAGQHESERTSAQTDSEEPRGGLARSLFALIALLYVASVPWYRPDDAPLRLWLGLPDWVTVAILCYVGVAVLNSIAWWCTDIADPDPGPADRDAGPAGEAR